MKIEKLPSGSYRVRKTIDKKTHTLTYDHKPTQAEINEDVAKLYSKISVDKRISFDDAAKSYIESKKNVLSPRTIKEYKEMPQRLSDGFVKKKVDSITQIDIQQEINILAKDKSPKTVRNYHAFISAVLKTFRPDMIINTTLPQKLKKEPYIPSDGDVKRVLEHVKKNYPDFYICLVLSAYGMRRSEILAITGDDVDLKNRTLHINKALVLDENKNWVIKTTKTTESTRNIVVPKEIAKQIKKDGYAHKGHANNIYKILNVTCNTLNIPKFSMHKLRHYFASKLLSENVDITTVMALGGWQSPSVLQKHYAHALEEKKKQALDIIDKSIV